MACLCRYGSSVALRLRYGGGARGGWLGRSYSSRETGPAHPDSNPSRLLRDKSEKERRQRERLAAIHAENARGTACEERQMKWTEKEKIVYSIPTKPGEKKDTSVPLPAGYSPQYVEACWYAWWEKQGFFQPEYHSRIPYAVERTYSLCIPPPNVTGSLHLGHALTVAIEDSLARWRRMRGCKVVWVPGCDHAGIATQVVVEKRLYREKGVRRQDLSREEFQHEVWRWKEQKGDEIYHQLRKLGASLDWERACFTMDRKFSSAVTEAFVRLQEAGLIYRGHRLVNWSCALNSAISDIEVDSVQLSGQTLLSVPGYQEKIPFGTMVTFAYPLEGEEGEISVATTRPETMLGDVAIIVHPEDPRYTNLHGRHARHPFTGRLLPILTDPLVDPHLGTGAVKCTPAHDPRDFEVSLRHALPRLSVIGGEGTMTELCGDWLQGVKRFEARQRVLDALKERGLYRSTQEHAMLLPLCSRSGDVVEPLLKSQWFLRCDQMARRAMEAVDDGQLDIIPSFHKKTWKNWLSNISDWCISRQLWWGHQIPAYRVSFPGSCDKQEQDDSDALWVCGRNQEEVKRSAAKKFGIPENLITVTQDTDVLDTWFSSGLFPFAMLGWPEQTPDLHEFYPNSLLETGSDLIFFWVARMVMLGQELTGQLPFSQVFLHSMIRDAHGRKMSKSLGNVIDPLDVISGVSLQRLHEKVQEGNLDPREISIALEGQKRDFPRGIPECGTDALRFALCSYRSQGDDINLDIGQVVTARHFCNKIWNAVKFTLGALGDQFEPLPLQEVSPASAVDRWVLSRLYHAAVECERGFEHYDFHAVTVAIHSFWLHSFCDVYLESVKPLLQTGSTEQADRARQVLLLCVGQALSLLAPFMPYLSEELWQRLPRPAGQEPSYHSISVAPYPEPSQLAHWNSPEEEANFLFVQEVVRVVRSLRAEYQLTKARPELYIQCSELCFREILESFSTPVQALCRSGAIFFFSTLEGAPSGCAVGIVNDSCQVYLKIQGLVDLQKELAKLGGRMERLQAQLDQAVARTWVQQYEERVPQHIREENTRRISSTKTELERTQQMIENFRSMLPERD
ncbi:valine--tRNA ligase, mitochondrial isoform X1 [Acipenser oxyrinchus oxyrinchus]|uniref:Valine--tRNA ligase n=1 Tax=Acipenser oxyrinchus oxyrinchus TaxID=40147 RepID=A0AAD8FVG7_ACIOX|nr:valine--tRNA ligase, mitochondrial isoform X1 [Acipenser oxyrinchus oxyrinchus]